MQRRSRQEYYEEVETAIDKAVKYVKAHGKPAEPQLYVDDADKDILAYDYAKEELVKCHR